MLTISNRLLNEISAFMKEAGYNMIAKKIIDPIITATADNKQVNAVIEDDAIISDIMYVLGKMDPEGRYKNQIKVIKKQMSKVA